jgi:hypothetical protein
VHISFGIQSYGPLSHPVAFVFSVVNLSADEKSIGQEDTAEASPTHNILLFFRSQHPLKEPVDPQFLLTCTSA